MRDYLIRALCSIVPSVQRLPSKQQENQYDCKRKGLTHQVVLQHFVNQNNWFYSQLQELNELKTE